MNDILNKLSVPFYSHLVEWKPQAVSADKQRALAAAYVDMREYEDRLDQVFPQWASSVQYLVTDAKVAAIVSLTVEGVTRVNVGEAPLDDPNAFTSAYAQGFKRACSDFGLGRYLYRLPQAWCDYDEKRRAIIGAPELPNWARHPEERAQQSAPTPPAQQPAPTPANAEMSAEAEAVNPGEVTVHFGRYEGKTLAEIWAIGPAGQGWVRWAANTDGKGFDPKGRPENVQLQRMARALLALNAAYAG